MVVMPYVKLVSFLEYQAESLVKFQSEMHRTIVLCLAVLAICSFASAFDCWKACKGRSGLCSACPAQKKACCRIGSQWGGVPGCSGLNGCRGFHCCAKSDCWTSCAHRGGKCEYCSVLGRHSCCRAGRKGEGGKCNGVNGCHGYHCCI